MLCFSLELSSYLAGAVILLIATIWALYRSNRAKTREIAKLKELAYRDPLTGAWTRRGGHEALRLLLRGANGRSRTLKDTWGNRAAVWWFSIVALDIDHFKKVNDLYGHEMGDLLLRTVVKHIRACTRIDDFVVRCGGDEFVLILPDTNQEVAVTRANAILRSIAQDEEFRFTSTLRVSVSIGVTARAFPSETKIEDVVEGVLGQETLKAADDLLYQSKQEGRNRVSVQSY